MWRKGHVCRLHDIHAEDRWILSDRNESEFNYLIHWTNPSIYIKSGNPFEEGSKTGGTTQLFLTGNGYSKMEHTFLIL